MIVGKVRARLTVTVAFQAETVWRRARPPRARESSKDVVGVAR
ncbi:hypothetical protein [Actinomycetospora chiangmaiensis]|nr:hypothetical protein [Actinomycetospora chiangmaiensis]